MKSCLAWAFPTLYATSMPLSTVSVGLSFMSSSQKFSLSSCLSLRIFFLTRLLSRSMSMSYKLALSSILSSAATRSYFSLWVLLISVTIISFLRWVQKGTWCAGFRPLSWLCIRAFSFKWQQFYLSLSYMVRAYFFAFDCESVLLWTSITDDLRSELHL